MDKVWIVLRPDYQETQLMALGICGAGFFIDSHTFVTSYHLLNPGSFNNNEQYTNTSIYLINPRGESIIVQETDTMRFASDKDLSYITTDKAYDFFEIENKLISNVGEEVINYGYPSSFTKDFINIKDNQISINKPHSQSGKILKIVDTITSKTMDVNIVNKSGYILDYSTESGFGGGPLLNQVGKVIGIMSFLLPQEVSSSRNAVAISSREF